MSRPFLKNFFTARFETRFFPTRSPLPVAALPSISLIPISSIRESHRSVRRSEVGGQMFRNAALRGVVAGIEDPGRRHRRRLQMQVTRMKGFIEEQSPQRPIAGQNSTEGNEGNEVFFQ